MKESYPHLTGLELADNTDGQSELKIDILISMDYYFSFFTGKKRQGISGPVAMESVIGWILGGSYWSPPGDNTTTNSCVTVVKCCTTSTVLNEDPVRKNLQTFWEVEAIGIPSEEEEDIAMETFQNNIYFNGSRYVTKLPFKEGCEGVPDNYSLCVGHLHSLRKGLWQIQSY